MSTTTTTTTAAEWLYDQGAPRYQALAFGDYVEHYAWTVALPTAAQQFWTDPRASKYLHRYGSTCYGKHLSEMCADCRTFAQFGEL